MARVYHIHGAVRIGPGCASLGVVPGAKSSIDFRKWFDRFQPQTLQIATWLLYISGVFMLIDIGDESTFSGYAWDAYNYGKFMILGFIAAHALGGLLMANDRKLGYWLALVAAFSPFFLSFWVLRDIPGVSFMDKLTGGSTISFIFNVALVALLLHPISREHQRVWYK
jgi:hypothetical protein